MVRCRETRTTFWCLFRAGERDKKKIANICGVSVKTISRYFKMVEQGDDLEPHYAKHTKYKFTPQIRRSMAQILAQNPRKSAIWLAGQLDQRWGEKFSPSGVRKVLTEMGYHHSVPKRTNLTAENKMVRLLWANGHINTDWRRVWSFDESYFNLDPSSGKVWVKNNVYHRVARRKLTNRQEKISVCIVVAISHNAKSDICYLESNWRPEDLINVLRDSLLPSIRWDASVRRCKSFLLDNDGRHHNRQLKEFLDQNGLIRDGYLPSNSPDLNPIENVFGIMKSFVQKLSPSNEQELREAIVTAWEGLSVETLSNLFESMPIRVNKVIQTSGERIRY